MDGEFSFQALVQFDQLPSGSGAVIAEHQDSWLLSVR